MFPELGTTHCKKIQKKYCIVLNEIHPTPTSQNYFCSYTVKGTWYVVFSDLPKRYLRRYKFIRNNEIIMQYLTVSTVVKDEPPVVGVSMDVRGDVKCQK
jgi:hypothetical protein